MPLLALFLALLAPAKAVETVLYTMGAGDDLFSRFGHASVCIEDERTGRCFNYGTADFGKPTTLVWDFLRGQPKFFVSVTTPQQQLRLYQYLDRTVYRQVLPFDLQTQTEALRMFSHDAKPENRVYLYHHYNDNCSTRLRDHIDTLGKGELKAATFEVAAPNMRHFTMEGFRPLRSLQLLTQLLLGRSLDEPRTQWDAMFHPDELRRSVEDVWDIEPQIVYERKAPLPAEHPVEPWIWLGGIGTALALAAIGLGRRRTLASFLVGVPIGLIGTIAWALAIVSSQGELRFNEMLLVIWGTDLLLVAMPERWRRRYLEVRIAVLALVALLGLIGVFIQPWLGPVAMTLLPLGALRFTHRRRVASSVSEE